MMKIFRSYVIISIIHRIITLFNKTDRKMSMEQTIYSSLKVNNEIELCEVSDMHCKQLIERELLKNRISYFVKWHKASLLRRKPETCVFCVNSNDKELAEHSIRALGKSVESKVEFLMNKISNDLF